MLRGGGLASSDGYDDSVYYAAATAVVHGRMPYSDFVLLHPPGLILALTPFAELARLCGDRLGQDIARAGFMALGALNAVLVMRLGRRFGLAAGLFAGLAYAVSFPALYAERTTTLEALGTTTLLVAMTLLVRPGIRHRPPPPLSLLRLAGAGATLGAGAAVKIWGVVPLAVLAVWVLVVTGWRAAAWLSAAALAAVTAICLPFFLRAPGVMTQYVVSDQLSRPRSPTTIDTRVTEMTGLQVVLAGFSVSTVHLAVVVVLAVLVAASVAALRTPGARVFVALLVAQGAVLLASPTFYLHYTTLPAAPAALLLGIGGGRAFRRLSRGTPAPLAWVGAVAALAVVVAYGVPGAMLPKGKHFPAALAAAAARTSGCITADDPTYLIEMNVLSRDLDAGCQVWIDVTGLTYDPAAGGGDGRRHPRWMNARWLRQLNDYLLSGSATMVERKATALDRASQTRIQRLPVLATGNAFRLRRVR